MAIQDGMQSQVIDTETVPAAFTGGEMPEVLADGEMVEGDMPVLQDQGRGLAPWQEELLRFIGSDNIAEELDQELLGKIGDYTRRGVETDQESSKHWMKGVEEGLKLARLEHESKSFPWQDASNVKFPLVANASMSFASRAYPEIVQGDKVVKIAVIGDDPAGLKAMHAERITEFMTWQILDQIDGWESGLDKLLNVLPNVGTLMRKQWYNEIDQEPCIETLLPTEFIINANSKSVEKARRITHVVYMYQNDVIERQRAGLWLDVDLGEASYSGEHDASGESGSDASVPGDDASKHCFYEQHCWHDLDGDGYEEPYVVTVHKDTSKVVRIVARYDAEDIKVNEKTGELLRITAQNYFTPYTFIPSQEGSFHGVGFGHLLYNLNHAINTTLNQLIDSGTLANTQGGFKSKYARIGGESSFQLGEWKSVDLEPQEVANAFFPLPTKEPSQVLFSLLGLLIETGQSIAQVTDVLTGQVSSPNASPTTVLAMVEQGLKVYNAIHKRIYRSLKCEFKSLMAMNEKHLGSDVYLRVLDNETVAAMADAASAQGIPFDPAQMDFDSSDYDVLPVADATMSTDVQRMARANILMQYKDDPAFNGYEVRKTFLEAIKAPNVDIMLPDPKDMAPPPPDYLTLDLQRQTIKDRAEMEIKNLEGRAKAVELMSKAVKNIADAEAAEAGTQLGQYRIELEALMKEVTQGGLVNGTVNATGIGGPQERPEVPEVLGMAAGRPGANEGETL